MKESAGSPEDVRVSALVDELAAVEERLDPESHAEQRRTADLITVLALLPITVALDWHAEQPLLMLGAMVGGLVLNRIPQWVTRWRLQREQDRLFDQYRRIRDLAQHRDTVKSIGTDGHPREAGE